MHRFIVWFNCFKTRFKSKRFIIPIIFAFALLFFPKDAFALTISSVQFLDNSNNVTATYTKSDIDNGIIGKDEPFLATKMRFNFTNSGLKSSTDYNFTSNFDLAGNRVFDTIFTSRLYSGSSQQTQSYKWLLISAEVLDPIYNANYSFNTNWTNNTASQDLKIEFDLGGEIIVYSFRLNQAKLLSEGENVGDSINNQTQELLDNQNKNQQQTNERLDELNKQLTTCRNSYNIFDGITEVGRYSYTDGTKLGNPDNIRNKNFIPVNPNTDYIISNNGSGVAMNVLFYDENKNYLYYETISAGVPFKTSSKTKFINFFRGSSYTDKLQIQKGLTITPFEAYGKEVCSSKLDDTNEKLDNLDKTLNDDNVSGATSTGNDFFDNFNSKDNGGISRIVTMPLTLINGLISGGTCSNLDFEVLGKEVYFPSGCILWQNAPSSILLIYQTIICGLFSYILATHLFKDIEDLKNPNKEEVSTLDL